MIITGLLLGAVFGLVLQRGRFCVTGAYRDLWLSKSTLWFSAFVLAIAVQAIGIAVLDARGVIALEAPELSIFATATGSLLFGIGIVFAAGCATGTYYRAGEGLVGSWFALGAYALSAAASKTGFLLPVTTWVKGVAPTSLTTIPETFGLPNWVGIVAVSGLGGVLIYRQVQSTKNLPALAQLPAEKSGLSHLLFEKEWHPWITGLLVGLIAIAAWPLSWASGREDGLGITTPSSNLVGFIVTGDAQKVDWGVLLVVGILLGSFISAKLSGEFRVRVPDSRTIVNSVIGGTLMGVGAAWAGGCSIGNALVQTATLSWQGWIALLFQILGVGIAAWFVIVRRRKQRSVQNTTQATKPEAALAAQSA